MKYELVIIWADQNDEKKVYEYDTEEQALEAEKGMKTALGNQIAWSCVREKI